MSGRILLPTEYESINGDPLDLDGIDHLEIYTANGRQACYYYVNAFGFTPVAYRGPETGHRASASYVLKQGKITLVLTTPLTPTSAISSHLMIHGDTVKDVALRVPHCEAFFTEVVKRGAEPVSPPTVFEDGEGVVKRASFKTYGETIHSIVERRSYEGDFWPGFLTFEKFFPRVQTSSGALPEVGLAAIDHIVGNVGLGDMNRWVEFYGKVLGFTEMQHFSDDDISTEYSALMSKVVRDGTGKVKFPINEPAKGRRKSQIEEYLDFHMGPGVQHVALITGDIIQTVSALKARGVNFLRVPETYYADLEERVGVIKEDLARIAELGILVDRDDDGYLLQLFTKPVHDRPTLFFEIIQRRGSQGFGVGNFKALFEAIEREQALRGNL